MSRLVDGLLQLAQNEDRATLAALRRGLGKRPGTAGEMFPWVIPRLPPSTQAGWNWEQQCHFLVASLFAWHPLNWATGKPWERNFGASANLLRLRRPNSDGPERRFVALLNAEAEDLPDHLRAYVGLLRADEVPVDWEQLLVDLTHWQAPNRPVQIRWARAFWLSLSDERDDGIEQTAADMDQDAE